MYKVIENRYIGEDMYLMRVEGKFEGKMGQFYMLRAWDKFPLLSRPISIHDIDENSISFLYKVVGEGTQILSKVKVNETIKLEGPYGNGYEKVKGKVALVGGGIGVAPLYLVAKNIENCDAYLGFRKEAILEYKVIKEEDNLSLLKINLITGRHHQIRLQLSNINHPIYGDQRYGFQDKKQIMLYAYKLEFTHPVTKELMTFKNLPTWDIVKNEEDFL